MKRLIKNSDADLTRSIGRRRQYGMVRAGRYHILKALRLKATPHAIAAGVAAGVASTFLPFFGIHFFISFAFAWLIGGNLIAAGIGTVIAGNPLTFPFIWAGTWETGQLLMGNKAAAAHSINLHDIFDHFDFSMVWQPILKPMLIGSIPFSLIGGSVTYILMLQVVRIFKARRASKFALR